MTLGYQPQFWMADFTFTISIAAALNLCPKLINLSKNVFIHVTCTCNLLNENNLKPDLLKMPTKLKMKEKIFGKPGKSQGLLYKHLSQLLIH